MPPDRRRRRTKPASTAAAATAVCGVCAERSRSARPRCPLSSADGEAGEEKAGPEGGRRGRSCATPVCAGCARRWGRPEGHARTLCCGAPTPGFDAARRAAEELQTIHERDEEASGAALLRYTPCFRCGALVERSDGCPDMTCVCGARFCLLCGLERPRHHGLVWDPRRRAFGPRRPDGALYRRCSFRVLHHLAEVLAEDASRPFSPDEMRHFHPARAFFDPRHFCAEVGAALRRRMTRRQLAMRLRALEREVREQDRKIASSASSFYVLRFPDGRVLRVRRGETLRSANRGIIALCLPALEKWWGESVRAALGRDPASPLVDAILDADGGGSAFDFEAMFALRGSDKATCFGEHF